MILIKRITVHKMQFVQKKRNYSQDIKINWKIFLISEKYAFLYAKAQHSFIYFIAFSFREKKLICWIIYFPECKLIFCLKARRFQIFRFPDSSKNDLGTASKVQCDVI